MFPIPSADAGGETGTDAGTDAGADTCDGIGSETGAETRGSTRMVCAWHVHGAWEGKIARGRPCEQVLAFSLLLGEGIGPHAWCMGSEMTMWHTAGVAHSRERKVRPKPQEKQGIKQAIMPVYWEC